MTPLIAIQLMGLHYKLKSGKAATGVSTGAKDEIIEIQEVWYA